MCPGMALTTLCHILAQVGLARTPCAHQRSRVLRKKRHRISFIFIVSFVSAGASACSLSSEKRAFTTRTTPVILSASRVLHSINTHTHTYTQTYITRARCSHDFAARPDARLTTFKNVSIFSRPPFDGVPLRTRACARVFSLLSENCESLGFSFSRIRLMVCYGFPSGLPLLCKRFRVIDRTDTCL